MNFCDVIRKAGQILDEERIAPTVGYKTMPSYEALAAAAAYHPSQHAARQYPLKVQEKPESFQFESANFDVLCALLDQVAEQERPALFGSLRSRILSPASFRHDGGPVLGSGSWTRCSSELPLLAEFHVRRGDKQMFIHSLHEAAPSPGLTLLLMQLEETIACNFTLFTEEECAQIPIAMESIRRTIENFSNAPKPSSTIESNMRYHVTREAPKFCDRVSEACRKARFFYVKGSLAAGTNLEVNQDKDRVRSFLDSLGFPQLLIESLDEVEKSYRAAATPFDFKSSMGHLRSFLEQLHLQACALTQTKRGGSLPSKWGDALKYLRDQGILTVKEEQFAAQFYALMSDTSVHPLVAEREYARLMRNVSIEYGLLLLTKLDKLGLRSSPF